MTIYFVLGLQNRISHKEIAFIEEYYFVLEKNRVETSKKKKRKNKKRSLSDRTRKKLCGKRKSPNNSRIKLKEDKIKNTVGTNKQREKFMKEKDGEKSQNGNEKNIT